MDKELVELYNANADEWYEKCCKKSKWTIDCGDVICVRCGRVLTEKIEAVMIA